MNKIDELIKKHCPNGVEFKKLSEITNLRAGDRIIKSMMDDSMEYSVYGGGVVPTGKYNDYNFEHSITISRAGSAGFVNWVEDKFWATDVCFVASQKDENVNIKYVYYYVKNKQAELQTKIYGGNLPKLNKDYLWQLPVPVPPLEVQCEIVHVLDDFTLLSAELSAELKARKKQYEYYKDEIYLFKDKDIKYVKLGEIAEIIRGGSFQKKDFVEKGKPCIHYGQIYTRYGSSAKETLTYVNEEVFNKSKIAKPNDIVMAVTSENIEDVCKCVVWLGEENIAVSGHTAIIHHNINAQYLGYYFSTSHFFKQKKKLAHGTKVIEVTPSSLSNIIIPIPDNQEQERIAKTIEKFDKLCNDISDGIPAEIEARRKQYEYYRDKLLNFKELKVEE